MPHFKPKLTAWMKRGIYHRIGLAPLPLSWTYTSQTAEIHTSKSREGLGLLHEMAPFDEPEWTSIERWNVFVALGALQ